MAEFKKSVIGIGDETFPRVEESTGKDIGVTGKDIGVTGEGTVDSTTSSSGNHDSDNTQAGKKKRGRAKKYPSQDMEWLAEKPQEIAIPVSEEEIPKPKKQRQSKKKILETKENLQQIFSIVSVFAGAIWQIDESEAEMIARPLDSILSRYNLLERTEKYGDGISLILATTAVFLPRVIFTINAKREEKLKKKELMEIGKQSAETTTRSESVHPRSADFPTASIKNTLHGLLG